ncbi:MAG: class I SAM-dependent methyltransferase [Candidatus Omnitrophota bacterium]
MLNCLLFSKKLRFLSENVDERADPDSAKWKASPWQNVFKERIEFVRQEVSDKIVLDNCCGVGWGTYKLAEVAKYVVGIDYSPEAINIANVKYLRANIRYLVMDALSLQFDDYYFDVVSAIEALEHFSYDDGIQFLREAKRVTKIGGKLIGSTPAVNVRESVKYLMEKNKYHLCLYSYSMLAEILDKVFGNHEIIFKNQGYFLFKATRLPSY